MSLHVSVHLPGRMHAELDLPHGVTAVIGPNGSGKSTLLTTVAGLVDGRVRVGTTDWTALPPHRRRVGFVPQDLRLFPHLTALENVAFGLRARGSSRAAARVTAREWLDRLGIAALAVRRPHELSGGQAQRVALARALATDPEVLLLDEPFAALDVAVAEELRVLLGEHLREFAGPVLLATHDTLDVTELATQVVVLEGGAVAQAGPVGEAAELPATSHAARLLGLNVVTGTADGTGAVHAGEEVLVTASHQSGAVLVTFPPTAVTLTTHRPTGSARNAWPMRVTGLTELDAVVRVHLAGGSGWQLRADVTTGAVTQLGLTRGVEVWASVKATEMSVFSGAAAVLADAVPR